MWVIFLIFFALVAVIVVVCRKLDKIFNGNPKCNRRGLASYQSCAMYNQECVYQPRYLLTKHEWSFYKELKPIADKLGFVVLSKIRMADLVEPVANSNSEYYRAFGKVKAKHIDFVLCRPENLLVELLIELDDSTHAVGNERDAFVEKVYAQAGYKLFRTRTTQNLEQRIVQALGDITMPKYSITATLKQPKVDVPAYQFSQDKNTKDFAADFEKQFGFKPEFVVKDKEEEHTGFPRSAEEYQRLYGNKKIEPPT